MRESPDARLQYLLSLVPKDGTVAQKAKAEALRLNKFGISINAHEAHLIGFFIRQFHCEKFVELGTLTGYSGLKILDSLSSKGHLWSFELDPEHGAIASRLFAEAGHTGRYSVLIGRAEEKLASIEDQGPFDGIFIDANKPSYPIYLEWALKHVKPGGLIIADNTLLSGVVAETEDHKPNKVVMGLRIFNERMSDQTLFDSILVPTKEGLSIGIKK